MMLHLLCVAAAYDFAKESMAASSLGHQLSSMVTANGAISMGVVGRLAKDTADRVHALVPSALHETGSKDTRGLRRGSIDTNRTDPVDDQISLGNLSSQSIADESRLAVERATQFFVDRVQSLRWTPSVEGGSPEGGSISHYVACFGIVGMLGIFLAGMLFVERSPFRQLPWKRDETAAESSGPPSSFGDALQPAIYHIVAALKSWKAPASFDPPEKGAADGGNESLENVRPTLVEITQ